MDTKILTLNGRCIGRVLLLFFLVLFVAHSSWAGEPQAGDVEKALQRFEAALQNEPNLTQETKDALNLLLRSLQQEREQLGPDGSQQSVSKIVDSGTAKSPSLWDRLTVYGDMRLRHETNTELDGKPSRNRQRVRFRLGANYQLTDEVMLGARMITGDSNDPNSSHQTLGSAFHSFEISLDRVFATYQPEWAPGLSVTAGKFPHPFWTNPVFGELMWDGDVQPEGATIHYRWSDLGWLDRLDAHVSEYILTEQGAADEAWVFATQVAAHATPGENWKADAALAYYRYTNLTPDASQMILADNGGNATVGTGGNMDFASRFEILHPVAALTYTGWKYPFTVSGEYFHNLRADIDEDTGWSLGASLGQTKKQNDWKLYYQWQVVEQDAVFSVVAQDDFLFQTNHRSHVFGGKYQWTDKIGFNLWALGSKRDKTFPGATTDSGDTQWRFRFDINFKF